MPFASFPRNEFDKLRRHLLRCWIADTYCYDSTVMKMAVDVEFRDLTCGIKTLNKYEYSIAPDEIARHQPVVRWMYAETQEFLTRLGVQQPRRIYHGVNRKNMIVQPLMSYTERKDVAEKFGARIDPGHFEVVHLPVEVGRIFMFYQGPGWEHGTFEDLEYIIIGRNVQEKK